MNREFFKSGHTPTLFSSFLYFTSSCMIWVVFGSLAVHISLDLELHPAQTGLMVALPVLFGALLRIPAGCLADHLGSRRTGQIGQVLVILALFFAWLLGLHSLERVYLMGFFLGIAGASFAVALPLAGRWYPPRYQGLALGIAGTGNIGTVLAALFAPRLAEAFGWQAVFGLAIIPAVVTLIVFNLLSKDAPQRSTGRQQPHYLYVLKEVDTWWFCLFYMVTFGGFIGLASSLVIYFNDQYGLDPITAGSFTSVCVFVGSLVRPLGGALADRIGGVKALLILYGVMAFCLFAVGLEVDSPRVALLVFSLTMLAFGMGNGAVFQLVPLRFAKEIGTITGIVGTAGGVGGFCLSSLLGFSKEWTGSYQLGFMTFAGLAVVCLLVILTVQARWRTRWQVTSVAVKI